MTVWLPAPAETVVRPPPLVDFSLIVKTLAPALAAEGAAAAPAAKLLVSP